MAAVAADGVFGTDNLRLVQRLLGHSKVTTTAIYADVLDEDVAAAQDAAWKAP